MSCNIPYRVAELQFFADACQTRGEFEKRFGFAYHCAHRRGILDQLCSHMPKHIDMSGENHPNFKYTDEEIGRRAKKYPDKREFRKHDPGAFSMAYDRGIMNKVCAHMPNLLHCKGKDHHNTKWTAKNIPSVAAKCSTKTEFHGRFPGAYHSAIKLGIFKQVTAHMPDRVDHSGEKAYQFKWPEIAIRDKAKEFSTRKEFRRKACGASSAADKLGIFDEVCSHMPRCSVDSISEEEIFDLIKSFYPKTQKLRVRNKNLVEGHPWICGFDIDVYIPELRLGIEFDGKFWHSPEGLRRSRKDWPEDDIQNYHQIKDAYFLSKDIKILHIKEEDWVENKEKCLRSIFNFLGIKGAPENGNQL